MRAQQMAEVDGARTRREGAAWRGGHRATQPGCLANVLPTSSLLEPRLLVEKEETNTLPEKRA